jgi:hypothetical protein
MKSTSVTKSNYFYPVSRKWFEYVNHFQCMHQCRPILAGSTTIPLMSSPKPGNYPTRDKTTTYTLNMLGTWEGYEENNLMNKTFNPLPTAHPVCKELQKDIRNKTFNPLPTRRSHRARPSAQRLL